LDERHFQQKHLRVRLDGGLEHTDAAHTLALLRANRERPSCRATQ